MASESDRILAAGVPLTLAGGRAVTLRYTMRSLKVLEDHFGSLNEAVDQLNATRLGENGEPPTNRKYISTTVPFLAAGLAHEGITATALYDDDLLDLHEMKTGYFTAISEALDQAFPTPASPGKDEAAKESSGDGSTTPPPGSGAATTSSGE